MPLCQLSSQTPLSEEPSHRADWTIRRLKVDLKTLQVKYWNLFVPAGQQLGFGCAVPLGLIVEPETRYTLPKICGNQAYIQHTIVVKLTWLVKRSDGSGNEEWEWKL